MWFNYVYRKMLSTGNKLPPQMGREINELSRWKLNFEHKIDNQGALEMEICIPFLKKSYFLI